MKLLFVYIISIGIVHVSFGQATKSASFKKAEKAYYAEEYSKAKSLYLKTLDSKGSCSQCLAQIANIYNIESNFNEALVQINKAIESENSIPSKEKVLGYYHSIRSFVYFNLGNLNLAKEDISEAIKKESKNDNYYFMRSLMRRMDGDLKGCCKDLESALKLGNTKAQEYLSIYCTK